MATKTPKGNSKNQGVSPNKLAKSQTIVNPDQANGAEYVVLDKDLVRGVSEKEVEIEHLRAQVFALQEKVAVLEDLKQDVVAHKALFTHSEETREELQIHIKETAVIISEDQVKHGNYQQELLDEIKSLKDQLENQKQHQAKREQEHLLKVDQINKDHNDKVARLNQDHHEKVTQLTNEFNRRLEQEQRESKAKYDHLFAEKETERQQKDSQIRQLEKEKEDQRKIFEIRISELENRLRESQKTILQLSTHIIELKQIIKLKADVEDQLEVARQEISRIDSQKSQLQKELETASDYILDLEEKVYKANKTSLELLRQLKDAEVEIETLKNYIIELKQRIAVYIPVKDDAIDKKLAEFINNYPERQKLKIMFMRESEGVYQFGTKRVAVRVDKDKINIRVGGGYLSIDEFLDQYTPAELEKLERKDPLTKFSQKIAVQKTIVGKEIRESSPVRSSPGKGNSPDKI